jgi:hypothetical protein
MTSKLRARIPNGSAMGTVKNDAVVDVLGSKLEGGRHDAGAPCRPGGRGRLLLFWFTDGSFDVLGGGVQGLEHQCSPAVGLVWTSGP